MQRKGAAELSFLKRAFWGELSWAAELFLGRVILGTEKQSIKENYKEKITLEDIAKKFTGMTPRKYRREVTETKALHAQDVIFIS